ncbi:hypothetical protein AWH51_09960 [Clavibacter tessellarius]|uniref:Uncharacterized protein n=1 Tax=Clavibacter tessellarius TaxID=31965 RepID=A0A154V149_9MICO|nr:hypothetical protein AWH51_09960 [Clavibacter michiganensis subsp. tessellarius]
MRERRGRGARSAEARALRGGRLVVVMVVLVDWWIGASSLLLPTLDRLLLGVRVVRMTDARPRARRGRASGDAVVRPPCG